MKKFVVKGKHSDFEYTVTKLPSGDFKWDWNFTGEPRTDTFSASYHNELMNSYTIVEVLEHGSKLPEGLKAVNIHSGVVVSFEKQPNGEYAASWDVGGMSGSSIFTKYYDEEAVERFLKQDLCMVSVDTVAASEKLVKDAVHIEKSMLEEIQAFAKNTGSEITIRSSGFTISYADDDFRVHVSEYKELLEVFKVVEAFHKVFCGK